MRSRVQQLAARFKEARLEKGIRQYEAAQSAGITPSTLSRFESGERGLDENSLVALSSLLGVEIPPDFYKIDQNDLGDRIREARRARGLSQTRLAKIVGTDTQIIYRIERGLIKSSSFLSAILAVLEIDLSQPQPDLHEELPAKSLAFKRVADEAHVVACLTAYIRQHGKREGLLDALVPAEKQDEGIARAMALIEYLSPKPIRSADR